jgi:hypothetical protein
MLLPPNYNLRFISKHVELRPISITELHSVDYLNWLSDIETTRFLKFDRSDIDNFDPISYVNSNRSKGFENFGIFFRGKFAGTINYNYKSVADNSVGYGIMIGDKSALAAGAGLHATMLIIYFFLEVIHATNIGPELTHYQNSNAISLLKYFGFESFENGDEFVHFYLYNISYNIVEKYQKDFKEIISYEAI